MNGCTFIINAAQILKYNSLYFRSLAEATEAFRDWRTEVEKLGREISEEEKILKKFRDQSFQAAPWWQW